MDKNYSHFRAGVIGTGFIAPVHIEALRRLGISVTALCGSDKATSLAQTLNIPEVYTGYDFQSLIDSPQVDVVHITSPNKFHYEMSLATLRAGKHCICEKPLALGWSTPKLPGYGEVNWGKFFSALTDTGYDGPVCIEVEDVAYAPDLHLRKRALKVSRNVLRDFVI